MFSVKIQFTADPQKPNICTKHNMAQPASSPFPRVSSVLVDYADWLCVRVGRWQFPEEIIFLHQIEEGGTDRSYGIHVARLAGLPPPVLDRSRAILERLERDEEGLTDRVLPPAADVMPAALDGLFDLMRESDAALLDEIRTVDEDSLAPIDAWDLVKRLRQALADEGLNKALK